jgi:hypothetical protein
MGKLQKAAVLQPERPAPSEKIMTHKIAAGLVCLLVFNLSVGNIFAQNDDKKTAKVKAHVTRLGIGRKARIDVKTYDGTEVVGWVSQRGENDFVVTDDFNDVKTIAYKDVKGFVGKELSTGQKIWIGVGIGFGVAIGLFVLGRLAASE